MPLPKSVKADFDRWFDRCKQCLVDQAIRSFCAGQTVEQAHETHYRLTEDVRDYYEKLIEAKAAEMAPGQPGQSDEEIEGIRASLIAGLLSDDAESMAKRMTEVAEQHDIWIELNYRLPGQA